MSQPPDIAQLLANVAAASGAIDGVGQGKRASILLDSTIQILAELEDFSELLGSHGAGQNGITGFKILLSCRRIFELSLQAAAQGQHGHTIALLLQSPLRLRDTNGLVVDRPFVDKLQNSAGIVNGTPESRFVALLFEELDR